MPQEQQHRIDRESVRLLAIEFGVREAARRTGLNSNTVRQWSRRYHWLDSKPHPNSTRATVTSVTKPGDILLAQLQANEEATRLGLSSATASAATELAALPGASVVKAHHALRNVSAAAATLYRWRENTRSGDTTNISLNQLAISEQQLSELQELHAAALQAGS